jgi:DNA-binding NarL/FixJ family response regulator
MTTVPAKKIGTVLIVDDNMNFVDRMIGLLDEAKSIENIIVASDYDEARKVLAHEEPDIALLDINLPGKNGIELLKLIRASNKPCEVIMITNHADDYYRQQCFDLGAKYFLDKSNDFAQVPSIIKNYATALK